jgi:hypothetical protein
MLGSGKNVEVAEVVEICGVAEDVRVLSEAGGSSNVVVG